MLQDNLNRFAVPQRTLVFPKSGNGKNFYWLGRGDIMEIPQYRVPTFCDFRPYFRTWKRSLI